MPTPAGRAGSAYAVPGSVTSIGEDAFAGCGLAGVGMSGGVTNIGDYAFNGCSSLTNIAMSGSVLSIGNSAFAGCSKLTSVAIPASVTSIGGGAFDSCFGLTGITVDGLNPDYASAAGVLFDKNLTALIRCPEGVAGSYAVPGGVTNMMDGAFRLCTALTDVAIPASVISIPNGAFETCSTMTNIAVDVLNPNYASVGGVLFDKNLDALIEYPVHKLGSYVIPDGVSNIVDSAFYGCGLTNVTIPGGVTNIGNYAFNGCGLTAVSVPGSVVSIGDYAFESCYSLTAATIPIGVTRIGNSAFDGCGLTAITIPASVTSIGSQAFGNCSKLTDITIPGSLTNIPQSAFIGCYGLTNVTIPDGVTSMGDYAFGYCSGLARVIVPGSVTNIGHSAFRNCAKLTSAFFEGNAPGADNSVFHLDSGKVNGTAYYLPGKTGWRSTFGGLPAVEWKHPPTLQLTSPVSGQSLSSAVLTVAGTASDALGVAAVQYELNTNGWMTPAITNDWTHWSGSLALSMRSNTVRAYAVDILGSVSATQSVDFLFIQRAALTVRTNGQGAIAPPYDGRLLEIGERYTMTAKASTGFAFADWTDGSGGGVTNKPALTFTMASNLSFTANFVDVAKPTLAITNLPASLQWGSAPFTVKGWARDNVAVSNVWYRFNGNAWTAAEGTTNWSAALTLSIRTNNLKAYAVDEAGNLSATSSVSFFYIPSATLSVRTNGPGAITPDYNGKLLALGQTYSLVAVPDRGCLLSNWTGGAALPAGILTNGTHLRFVMQSNYVVQANFVTNPFAALAATYSGLFYNTNGDGITASNAGYFIATVAKDGSYSGKLASPARTNRWIGKFELGGAWSANLAADASALDVSLQLDLDGRNAISGIVSNSGWTAQLQANRNGLWTHNAAKYTLVIPGSDDTNEPAGDGIATVSVDRSGNVALAGTLGDGTPVAQSTSISEQGRWPLYLPLYKGGGLMIGWLAFDTNQVDNDFSTNSTVVWIKPASAAGVYTNGFAVQTNVMGSRYQAGLPMLDLSTAYVTFTGQNLSYEHADKLVWANSNLVMTNAPDANHADDENVRLIFKPASGWFNGGFVNSETGQTNPIHGVVLQKQTNAFGYFPGISRTGRVSLRSECAQCH